MVFVFSTHGRVISASGHHTHFTKDAMQESEDVCKEAGSLLGDALFYLPWVTAA